MAGGGDATWDEDLEKWTAFTQSAYAAYERSVCRLSCSRSTPLPWTLYWFCIPKREPGSSMGRKECSLAGQASKLPPPESRITHFRCQMKEGVCVRGSRNIRWLKLQIKP